MPAPAPRTDVRLLRFARARASDFETHGVLVTVTDVDAGDVNFHFKVDAQPQAAG